MIKKTDNISSEHLHSTYYVSDTVLGTSLILTHSVLWHSIIIPTLQMDTLRPAITQSQKSHFTTCREPARDIPLMTKVMRKEARHTQRWDRASGVPRDILEHLPPQTRVCLLSAFCFHLHLWLYGGCPPLPLSEKKRVSLQLQLIIPGCDSVSTYKLLWKSSSLPE